MVGGRAMALSKEPLDPHATLRRFIDEPNRPS